MDPYRIRQVRLLLEYLVQEPDPEEDEDEDRPWITDEQFYILKDAFDQLLKEA